MNPEIHIPVLLSESIAGLNLKKNSVLIDATMNGGGHAKAFLKEIGPGGRLIGLDWDPEMIERQIQEWKDDQRVTLIHSNFSNLEKVAGSLIAKRQLLRTGPDAIFFDLGISSFQLSVSGRGFSFNRSDPLKMTIDSDTHPDLEEFLREASEEEIADVIWKYGEERQSRRIARAIKIALGQKQIKTTEDLAHAVERAIRYRGKTHPATKTFQAFRIHINHELENLEEGLEGAFKILKPGGRIAVISFHSLEDRIVKNYFKELVSKYASKIITKKPIRPQADEIKFNPRARSAKLRIIEK